MPTEILNSICRWRNYSSSLVPVYNFLFNFFPYHSQTELLHITNCHSRLRLTSNSLDNSKHWLMWLKEHVFKQESKKLVTGNFHMKSNLCSGSSTFGMQNLQAYLMQDDHFRVNKKKKLHNGLLFNCCPDRSIANMNMISSFSSHWLRLTEENWKETMAWLYKSTE